MINRNKGKLLYVAPLRNYLLEKIFGILGTAVVVMVLLFITMDSIIYGRVVLVPVLIILGISFLVLVQTLFWAFSNRVKIYEYGIVPAILPFKRMFELKEYFAPYESIIDMRGVFSGAKINKIIIELENGEKLSISCINVGTDLFNKLLRIRDKFYRGTEYDKKISKILLDKQ